MPIDTKKEINNEPLKPVNLDHLTQNNIYKNVILCCKRAEQIQIERNNQFKEKMNDWLDYDQKDFNTEKKSESVPEKISKYYEKLNKSTNIAINEFENDEIIELKSYEKYIPAEEEEKIVCPICTKKINKHADIIVKTTCGHIFHKKCIEYWIKKEKTCPICSTELI